jgi:hypothetical protein
MKPPSMEELTRKAFLIRSAATLGVVSPLVKVFPATALRALQDQPLPACGCRAPRRQ